ncbi:hypothetical protein SJI19_23200 [Acerihabitans sp. TG2]|uniref:hypothetical protein n=1 Tax=Acerihabitans sp. TG2 TaxID=3096008 RepID=UPI002B235A35|nr:hypothetical protein [Acerihabitans sp. TG2]MEA9393404.1 hypothetical protein [Acerihabitans sp. TG2]
MNACVKCQSEHLIKLNEMEDISFKNVTLPVYSEFSRCESCGDEFINKEQGCRNDLAFLEAKQKADEMMPPDL